MGETARQVPLEGGVRGSSVRVPAEPLPHDEVALPLSITVAEDVDMGDATAWLFLGHEEQASGLLLVAPILVAAALERRDRGILGRVGYEEGGDVHDGLGQQAIDGGGADVLDPCHGLTEAPRNTSAWCSNTALQRASWADSATSPRRRPSQPSDVLPCLATSQPGFGRTRPFIPLSMPPTRRGDRGSLSVGAQGVLDPVLEHLPGGLLDHNRACLTNGSSSMGCFSDLLPRTESLH